MRKYFKKTIVVLCTLILILFVSVHLIDDKVIFGKKGKLFKLDIISSFFDFLYSPLSSDSTYKIDIYKLNKLKPGISCEGIFAKENWSSECELLHIPKLNNPYFEIKLLQNKNIKRKKSIKLYPFEKAFLAPFYGNLIGEKLSLINQKYELILLDFESLKHPYIYREKYNSGLIEKQKISNGIHFKIEKVRNEFNDGYEIVMINDKSYIKKRFIYDKIDLLNKTIRNNDFNSLKLIFDLDYLSRYFIFCHLTGRNKFSETRWIYRLTDGKIYPIATSHNSFKKIKIKKNIWNFILKNNEFKNHLLKNLKINSFPNEENLKAIQKKNISILSHYNRSAKLSQRELNYLLKKDKKTLTKNTEFFSSIKNTLKEKPVKIKSCHESIDSLISKFGFLREGNKICIKTGIYQLDENIILPEGYNLSIDSGTILFLNDSVNFIINGTININGTSSNKVIIKSVNNSPFGVIGSVGNNRDTSIINNLEINNGSEAFIDGKYFSGALSLYHQNVIIRNSSFLNNKADDGLNVKYGNIIIENSIFKNNWADQVDIDFCDGEINNCKFNSEKGDSNGDGLDLSGSNVTITHSIFNNFNDKGLSIGEKSIASLSNSIFTNNLNAISIKDLSKLYAINNTFTNNNTVFNLYRKKLIFGGGFLEEHNNNFKDNLTLIIKDSLSNIISN